MPIYLYLCRQCGHKIELLRAMNEKDSGLACPKCGAKKLEKVFSSFYSSIGGPGRGFSFG